MRKHRRVGVTVLLLVVSAAAIAVLSPGGSTDSNAVGVQSSAVSPSGTSAMRVYLDPETGEVGGQIDPNAVIALDSELENALSQDSEGLVTENHANGAVSINLQGRFESASFVRIGKDGKFFICTDHVAGAEAALNDQSPISGAPEVK